MQDVWTGSIPGKVKNTCIIQIPSERVTGTPNLKQYPGESPHGSSEMNLTSIHEDTGSIPGLP